MKYCVDTPKRGLMLKPEGKWDGSKKYQFVISSKSDSDSAKCPTTRKSATGFRVFLNGAPVVFKSVTQKRAAMSVCEAELCSICGICGGTRNVVRQTISRINGSKSGASDGVRNGQQRSCRSL